MMKHLALGLVFSLGAAACGSNPPPPPESGEPSAMVENADSSANMPGSGGSTSEGMGSHPMGGLTKQMEHGSGTPAVASPPAMAAGGGGGGGGVANDSMATGAVQPDNSKVNARDKGGSTLTPMDQGTSEGDRKIT